jgi:hypothetical protein
MHIDDEYVLGIVKKKKLLIENATGVLYMC